MLGRDLAELAPRTAVEAGPGPVRAVLSLGARGPQRIEELVRACRELGRRRGAAVGLSELHESPADSARAYRQALDATMIGRALLGDGGAIGYAEVGAYRYLVHIAAENAPHDRMRAAVDRLIAYDAKRRTSLLDTLERYLAERRSVIESARELFIHPNTLRQRLGRIEELTGLNLDEDDLLSLELAIKLARLHGRPAAARGVRGRLRRRPWGHVPRPVRDRARWGRGDGPLGIHASPYGPTAPHPAMPSGTAPRMPAQPASNRLRGPGTPESSWPCGGPAGAPGST